MKGKVTSVVGLLIAMALGCVRVPPQSVALDRFDYGQAIADSWKRQTLANIVRLRYGDAPTFLEVTSVINSYSTSGALTAGASIPESPDGNNLNLGASRAWSNSPTVTYQPLTGQKFTANLLRPVPPSAVFQMVSAGWPVQVIFGTSLRSINGLSNNNFGKRGDPDFARLLEALGRIQRSHAIGIRVEERKEGEAVAVLLRKAALPEQVLEDSRTVRTLLGLKDDATEFSVTFGSIPTSNLEIAVETRSMLELMLELATGVDVPPTDLAEGRALPGLAAPGETPPEPLLHVRCGKTAPSDAFAAVPYRNLWFWIDDTDRASKSKFTFLMILFSLAEGGQTSAAPLVTISTGK
jgi:hypothetical protein